MQTRHANSAPTVVGYNTELAGKLQFTAVAPTFVKVDGSPLKIMDLIPDGNGTSTSKFNDTSFFIIIWDTNGNPMKVANDPWINEKYPAYASRWGAYQVQLFYYPDEPNWYHFKDPDWETVMSDYEIPAGCGYTIYCGSAFANGVKLTNSGEVDPEDLPVTAGKLQFKFSGNVAPVDRTIKDFIPNPNGISPSKFNDTSFFLIMWNTDGNPLKVQDDEWIKAQYPAYASRWGAYQVQLFYYPDEPNWYHFKDPDWETVMSDYPIKAGQAFTIYAGSAFNNGVTLTIPSAIEKAK